VDSVDEDGMKVYSLTERSAVSHGRDRAWAALAERAAGAPAAPASARSSTTSPRPSRSGESS